MLSQSPGWATYQRALERLFDINAAPLGSNLEPKAYAFQCGVVHTLRVVAGLPDDLSQKLEDLNERTRPTRPVTDPGTLVNTPFFGGWLAGQQPAAEPGRPGAVAGA